MVCPLRAVRASLGLWLGVGLLAQDFVPVRAAVPAARPVLVLSAEVRLALTAGQLRLVTAGAQRPVGCTVAGGAGTVHAMAQNRFGTVFVAAENGLFVLDAAHPVLDPMDLRDGVPPGTPQSLLVDDRDRLWLCTDQAFGVVDARFGFGRTFAETDGLPAAPFARIASDGAGRILLAARDGTFAYTPDVGPEPATANPGAATARLVASPAGEVALDLVVHGRGTVSLRQRRQHDHQLRAMDGATLRGLRPGEHTVEVHAVDRDLRRRVVATYDVRVPLGPVLDLRVLPVIALAVAGLLFGFAFRAARAATSPVRRVVMAAGGSALVFVCGLQVLAACLGHGRSWPFVGFSMYTETWHRDSVLYKPRLQGLLADGSLVLGAEAETGLLQDGYWQMLAEVVFGGGPAQREFLARWNAGRHAGLPRLTGFRLVDGRIRLSADGPVDTAPTVLVVYEER
ncbi:MAG: hypothetical protein JNM25_18885 [Planctomycetes bacterium]|nr:hypothetical protein [Planctomycetota bacterium]